MTTASQAMTQHPPRDARSKGTNPALVLSKAVRYNAPDVDLQDVPPHGKRQMEGTASAVCCCLLA